MSSVLVGDRGYSALSCMMMLKYLTKAVLLCRAFQQKESGLLIFSAMWDKVQENV